MKNNGSYLADDLYKKPVIIYDYPKQLKPFYARLKEDLKTVSAFDLVVPKVKKTCQVEEAKKISIQAFQHGVHVEY